MVQGLFSVAEVNKMIERGDTLLLAGHGSLFSQLSKGKWIGGATSRFIENGKEMISVRDKIFVHNLADIAADVKFSAYNVLTVSGIYNDAFENGFTVLILPFGKGMDLEYASNCINYPNFGNRAVCGWRAVLPNYSEYERDDESLVFMGTSGERFSDMGVAMHVKLPEGKYAELHVFNPYKPENDDVIVFEEDGPQSKTALINGVRKNLRQYLIENGVNSMVGDTVVSQKSLSGDYGGMSINVVIFPDMEEDIKIDDVLQLGAPVIKDIRFRLSSLNLEDNESLKKKMNGDPIVFSFA